MNGQVAIENAQIAELAASLADAKRRTREDIVQGMELAYKAGRLDGAIELANKMLTKAPAE